jgi:CRISPR-associated protein Cmr4
MTAMKQKLLYLFTRTPLHIGAGASVGAIDQPIVRERPTGFPVIPGSSIKGVLADNFLTPDRKARTEEGRLIFGHEKPESKEASAGRISFGEAKILAFPVRSAKGSFAFVTCRLALERFRREHGGLTVSLPDEPRDMHCLAGDAVTLTRNQETGVVLEEYKFTRDKVFPADWERELLKVLDDPVWQTGQGRFVLLSNGDFSHFVKHACEVSQHVAIDASTGTAKGGFLFNLEAVPAETLFFAPLTSLARSNGEIDKLAQFFRDKPVLQFGGDSTTGLGFCTIKLA